jgi:hypothetical protein
VRGSARFAIFAAGKFATRALGQSLAREFGPRGVHVAHVIVDGAIDIPRLKGYTANEGKEDGKIRPDAVSFDSLFFHCCGVGFEGEEVVLLLLLLTWCGRDRLPTATGICIRSIARASRRSWI